MGLFFYYLSASALPVKIGSSSLTTSVYGKDTIAHKSVSVSLVVVPDKPTGQEES
jgi:hypothetical protein